MDPGVFDPAGGGGGSGFIQPPGEAQANFWNTILGGVTGILGRKAGLPVDISRILRGNPQPPIMY